MNRREKLEHLIEKQPADPFLPYALAMEWMKEGNEQAALEKFDRALSIDPDYLAAYYHKARALLATRQDSAAKACLDAGLIAARRKADAHAESEMLELLATIETK